MGTMATVLVAAMVGASVKPSQPPMQPQTPWVADYEDTMCVLQRQYGVAPDLITLAFRPVPLQDRLSMYVLDAPRHDKGGFVPLDIIVAPGIPAVDADLSSFDLGGLNQRYNATTISRAQLEQAAATGVIELDAGSRLRASFAIPGLHKALSVLDSCIADLLVQWGFSREQQALMAKPPEVWNGLSLGYAGTAFRKGETGTNAAWVKIDAHGKPSNCTLVESSKSKSLDWALCDGMLNTIYHAAVDKSGKTMDSIYFVRMRWTNSRSKK